MASFKISLLALAATLTLSSMAHAQTPAAENTDAPEEQTSNTVPVTLILDADQTSDIDPEVLRARLESALKTPVTLAPPGAARSAGREVKVQLRDGHTAFVTYRDESGRVISRSVDVSGEKQALVSSAALLAENLVQDQTSDLLAGEESDGVGRRKPSAANAPKGPWVPAIVSLFHPVATNWTMPNARTPFALDLVYGRNGGIGGAQLSGAVGYSSGAVTGAQLAGAVTIAQDLSGAQLAGAVAAARNVSGLQISGAANIAENLQGAQFSVINIGGDVSGAQIGVVNIGKRVRGLQLGVVNVADSVDGASLGVISYIRNGHIRGVGWASSAGNTLYGNAGIEWSSKYAYALVHGSYTTDHVGPGVRFGLRVPFGDFRFDADVGSTTMFLVNGNTPRADANNGGSGGSFFGKGHFTDGSSGRWLKTDSYAMQEARVMLGYNVTSFLSVFGGGGFSVAMSNDNTSYIRLAPTGTVGISLGN